MKLRPVFAALIAGLVLTFDLALRADDPGDPKPARIVDLQGNPFVEPPTPPAPAPGAAPTSPATPAPLKAPRLELFPTTLPSPKGTFIVCPGGAYHFLATRGEGTIPGAFLNRQGYDVVLLEYTVGPGDVMARALQDALATVKLLQQNGDKLGLHTATLGMMGFSAGGHLTARTEHELGVPGAFTKVVMIYPAYLDDGPGGFNPAVAPPKGAKTQFFVAIGDKDAPGWVASSKVYVDTAQANGQQAEYHLLPGIPHAFGVTPGDAATTADFQKKLAAFLAK
jgi:acetyl esterase/lipase